MMHTEMSLHPDEFDNFQIREDADITFCLKELRVRGLIFGSLFYPITWESCACGCVWESVWLAHPEYVVSKRSCFWHCNLDSLCTWTFMWTFALQFIFIGTIMWLNWHSLLFFTEMVIGVIALLFKEVVTKVQFKRFIFWVTEEHSILETWNLISIITCSLFLSYLLH